MSQDAMLLQADDQVFLVVETDPDVMLLMFGESGPQGVSGSEPITAITGELIPGDRAVYIDALGLVRLGDKDDATKVDIVGVTVQATLTGLPIDIFVFNELTESSWAWTPGLIVYLGNGGLLTQVVPTTGFLVVVGVATAPTKLLVAPEPPIAFL